MNKNHLTSIHNCATMRSWYRTVRNRKISNTLKSMRDRRTLFTKTIRPLRPGYDANYQAVERDS
jgi:hypothetical protein